MNASMTNRLRFVSALFLVLAGLLVYRLVTLQFGVDTAYFAERALTEYRYQVTVQPPRGELYDRNGVLLATNTLEYEISMSPSLVYDRETTADILVEVLGMDRDELLAAMADSDSVYVQLARPASASQGQRLLEANLDGISITPLPRRYYPHGVLAAQVLGFVSYDDTGYYGIEGYYNEVLGGNSEVGDQSRIPFDATIGDDWQNGANLYLTVATEVQYLAEDTLAQALRETGATSGQIIVYQPQTGEILAMASDPMFDPNLFYTQNSDLFGNPNINDQFEPGSTFKAITMALALEYGIVEPDSTYVDNGVLEVGGLSIYNWDRGTYGVTSMTDLLAKSLNVGAAQLSVAMGPTRFYDGIALFGIGEPTGIDLQGEVGGSIRRPGSANWFESDLATNAFGQGLAVTPLQMVVAFGALANDGLLMQPHMIMLREDADGTQTEFGATVVGRAVSQATANDLTRMLANALEREASAALVEGYRIAGKTGTAQIPVAGGYDPDETIATFIGYGPVDDPQFVVLVKLDRPTSSPWGSQTAAPVFGYFVERLVVLLEIPPDAVRLAAGR